jgi:hypothetical protein
MNSETEGLRELSTSEVDAVAGADVWSAALTGGGVGATVGAMGGGVAGAAVGGLVGMAAAIALYYW